MRSRAVLRLVQPANEAGEHYCAACDERIVFSARKKPAKVIANVYENGRWNRTDHFHADCYSGQYGEAVG